MKEKAVLITVTHDPEGKNSKLFKTHYYLFQEIYSKIYLTISDETSKEFIQEVQNREIEYRVIPKKGVADARREALKLSLRGDGQYYHYCDLDRILTWASSYPEELQQLVTSIPNYHYLIIGRTERAMRTHPLEWIKTEEITNQIFSLELGKETDITAGSCAFSRECAVLIQSHSRALMTDAEWAMIAKRIGDYQIDHVEVDGLKYQEDVNGVTREMSYSDRWFNRLRLSCIISETARNTGK